MMTRTAYTLIRILMLFVVLAPAALSFGQSGRTYPYGHIRYAEGDVTLQRALEPEAGEAAANVPVMPGDRLWTATYGRAEVLFADGSVLQLDERSKVDFTAFGETGEGETLLRLWSGSILLRIVDATTSYRLDTPSGSIFPVSEGLFRIDVDDTGTATVSVYEGVAELASDAGSVLVRTGQRSFVQAGLRPESPFEFNTALYDAFASWSDRRERLHRYTRRIEGLPDEVAVYAGELEHYGSWRHDVSHGYVWYPAASVGWSPYTHGRWSYTSFGWTWISYEPWGWAPYHYGRWGHGSFGWYWIPGTSWGPAWVSWAFGPTWVGWSPLGYHNRPIVPYRSLFDSRGGHAVPRYGSGHGWSFARNDDFRSGRGVPVERTRLRVEDVRATANQGRLFESGAILDRELNPRAVGSAAMTTTTNRTEAASSSRSTAAVRGDPRRNPREMTIAPGRTGTSRGYALPRSRPMGTTDDAATSGGAPSSTRSAPSTGRAAPPTGRRGGEASQHGRVSAGVQRGGAGTLEAGESRGSPPPAAAPGAVGRAPSSVPSPSGRLGTSRGAAPTRTPAPGVTRGPAVERSKGSSTGSKDFFGRGPSSLASPSERTGPRATSGTPRASSPSRSQPDRARSRTPSSNRSSKKSDSSNNGSSGNRSRNRQSSRDRN